MKSVTAFFRNKLRAGTPPLPRSGHNSSQSSVGTAATAITTTIIPAVLSGAEALSKLAPIPWIAPAFASLNVLIALINQAQANRQALSQLQDRCISFLVVIEQNGGRYPTLEQQKLVAGAKSTLDAIGARMDKWASKSRIKLFLEQAVLVQAIQDSHLELDDSLKKLHLTAALDTAAWQAELKENAKRDHDEFIAYLSNIENGQAIIMMAQQQHGTDIKAMLTMMQQLLPSAPEGSTEGLGKNLYRLQSSAKELLPDMHLQRGEVQRVGKNPVGGNESMDIWEGIYLNEAKVAIKMIRAVHASPKSFQRFEREVEIWKKVWEADRGQHIQPLYGFYQHDGPFPYVVSPWPEHETADKYVARYPDTDHRALIRGIIAGVNVLHTMNPPIVHGDLRGANIVIDASWKPLLADFGFSRIVEDTSGVPFSRTTGVSSSERWLAPELFGDNAKLTTATDIYSFGMTVLELMTHAVPWASVKTSLHVIVKVSNEEKPPRPTDPAVITRGLDDKLWAILETCWGSAETRPTATELVEMLQ